MRTIICTHAGPLSKDLLEIPAQIYAKTTLSKCMIELTGVRTYTNVQGLNKSKHGLIGDFVACFQYMSVGSVLLS